MSSRRGTVTEAIALAVVPCLLILAGIALRAMTGPFEADPDYAYLLNGLDILTFHPPGHFDHPGTTLQILVALVSLPAWLFSMPFHGLSDVKSAVLSHPQYFLQIVNLVLVAADGLAAFYMGRQIRKAANLPAALVAQISVLMSFSVAIGLNRATPEPLLLASSLLLAGYLAPAVLRSGHFAQTRAYASGLGALLGFILVTKVTALPLLLTIFFLNDRHLRLTAAKAIAIAALLLTLPIAVHYLEMARWFARLFIHTEAYGSGKIGVPTASKLWQAFTFLLGQTPEIFIIFAFYVASFPLWRGAARRVVAISILVLAVSILMVLKEPGARYFMPVVGSIALANAAIISQVPKGPAIVRAGGGLLILLLVLCVGRNAFATLAWAQDASQTEADNQKLIAKTSAVGCQLAYFYDVNTPVYDLGFGDDFTPKRFRRDLDKLYPNALFYDAFGHRFETFTSTITLKEMRSRLRGERCLYLIGSPIERLPDFGISRADLSLVGRTNHGLGDSVAVYAWQPR